MDFNIHVESGIRKCYTGEDDLNRSISVEYTIACLWWKHTKIERVFVDENHYIRPH